MISYNDASKYIRNKRLLHEAMGRDGWELPAYGSPICTLEFLDCVRRKIVWCLRREELNCVRKCYSKPTKKVLLQMVIDTCQDLGSKGQLNHQT